MSLPPPRIVGLTLAVFTLSHLPHPASTCQPPGFLMHFKFWNVFVTVVTEVTLWLKQDQRPSHQKVKVTVVTQPEVASGDRSQLGNSIYYYNCLRFYKYGKNEGTGACSTLTLNEPRAS